MTSPGSQNPLEIVVPLVAVERVAELVVSARNLAWSRQRGGREHSGGHYPVMVALHSGLLVGALLEARLAGRRPRRGLMVPMLGVLAGSQALRWWCIGALGPQWNTRIVVVPGMPVVRRGPYRWAGTRWSRHPNYVAVVAEGIALPLVGSAWVTAAAFTALNLPLLAVRIRAEEAAMAELDPA